MMQVQRIARIGFTTPSLARVEDFYAQLGFDTIANVIVDGEELAMLGLARSKAQRIVMRIGAQEVEFLSFDPPGRPYPDGSTATDGWFQHVAIVVADMSEAYGRALVAGATPITSGPPQTLPPNTGTVTAYKFRDPDGHPLELLAFPSGVGAPVWHETHKASPFLGIDHTAMVVADPARSEAFYRRLGLTIGTSTLNRGPEQSRLDDVDGDLARVVALTLPGQPPHLELLGYRVGTRRPMPAGIAADDVAATRTLFAVDRIDAADRAMASTLADGSPALMRKDPDGHRLILHEQAAPYG